MGTDHPDGDWNDSDDYYDHVVQLAAAGEDVDDAIQNIWVYKNGFSTPVATHQPNIASGTWNVNLSAQTGDWFVVKFQDTYTFASDPTYGRTTSKDLTWSAPVWYDPNNADLPLTVDGNATPTPSPTPEPTGGCSSVVINEILPANNTVYASDWVELYNPTGASVDLSGCVIDDLIGGGASPYTLPSGTSIEPYGFWVLDRGSTFNNAGDDVNLLDTDGTTVIDSYSYGSTAYDVSWYRSPDGGTWQSTPTSSPTKGTSNGSATPTATPEPTATPTPTPEPTATATPTPEPTGGCSSVVINEILPANNTVYTSDWVELYNPTGASVDLSGCVIDDLIGGGASPYTLPSGTSIAAYGFWVLDLGSTFNNAGDDVNLLDTDGTTVIDSYSYGSTAYDVSWYRSPDGGTWQSTVDNSPTKGTSNTAAEPTPTPAPVAPVISSVTATSVGQDRATITWLTDVSATSQVAYGRSPDPDTWTTLDATLVTDHTVYLSGLQRNKTYYYRVLSQNADGVESTSEVYSFKTTK